MTNPRPEAGLCRAVTALMVTALVSGCSTGLEAARPTVTVTVTQTATPSASLTSSTAPPATNQPARPLWDTPTAGAVALDLVKTLPVRAAQAQGYRRDAFGQRWSDASPAPGGRNGCDTRNDVLRRDLTAVQLKPGTNGCVVLSGALVDPYSGRSIDFVRGVASSSAVQIDHVVSLRSGWQAGAHAWTDTDRVAFANDPLNLVSVSGEDNVSKGDRDAAGWLPKNLSYRCEYVARQVAVKARWRLSVTPAERETITRTLQQCPGQKASARPWRVPAPEGRK